MNFFEQELRKVAAACGEISNPVFAGRACFGDLGGDNRVKLQFVTIGTHEQYEALKATVLNRIDGEVDSLLFRFADEWGKKYDLCRNNGIPHIWTYNGKSEWYAYQPTNADIKRLAASVGAYLDVFTIRAPDREKAQESVVNKIREAKKPAAPKAKPKREKSGQEH